MLNVANTGTERLDPDEQLVLKDRIGRHGIKRVSEDTGLSREAIARLASGIPTRRGTVTQVRAALAAQRSDSTPPAHR